MKKFVTGIVLALSLSMQAQSAVPDDTIYVDVNGLVCDFCARALEKVCSRQDAVESIDVDLDQKVVTIYFNQDQRLDDETIAKLITDSGYDVRGIRHGG